MTSTSSVEKTNYTMAEILDLMDQHDSCLINLTDEDCQNLASFLMDKVDRIAYVKDKMEVMIDYFAAKEKEAKKIRTALENALDNLRKYIAFNMQNKGFEKLPGNDYQITLSKNEQVQFVAAKPTPNEDDVIKFLQYNMTRTRHEWSKTEVKKALEGKHGSVIAEEVAKFASITQTQSIKILPKPRKDLINGKQQSITVTTKS